jgi:hypothetical protein
MMRRKTTILNARLEERLFAYALVAGTGMTLTTVASAEIMYTPVFRSVHGTIGGFAEIPIDLNNDGIRDFRLDIAEASTDGFGDINVFPYVRSNKVIVTRCDACATSSAAAALESGAFIGPGAKFFGGGNIMASSYTCNQGGPWAHKIGRYLGLEFQENGKAHFGWARVNVGPCGVALTGYAYETVPGRPITAGQTQSNDESTLMPHALEPEGETAMMPATLGLLAQGASGLVAWRRQEQDGAFQINT